MIKGIVSLQILLLVLFFSPKEVSLVSLYAQDQPPQVRIAVIPQNPRPGEPVTVGFTGVEGLNFQAVLLNGQGKRLTKGSFFNLAPDKEGKLIKVAILAVPCTAKPGSALIQVEHGLESVGEVAFTINHRDFISEEIDLDQRNTDIRTSQDPQKIRESNILWGIISRTGSEVYAAGHFTPPVQSTRRTSFFGDRRIFKYVDGSRDFSIHAGIDYGVPAGTEVRSCAPGKVVLACFRIVTGNSVVVEHLPGVYSLYYHLDQIQVREGTMVDTSTVLGQSGSTGLATGPHLHWEIRVAGENTDPDAFVSRSILDKETIMSIFNSF
jgi:hypothetical protein